GLIEQGDIRGDLHDHTTASDGRATIDALIEAARARGYEYIAITDHSLSSTVGGGLSADELRAHVAKIREAQARHPEITVLAGTPWDRLPDGPMDYPDDRLVGLDI